jgi:hypothetical protein
MATHTASSLARPPLITPRQQSPHDLYGDYCRCCVQFAFMFAELVDGAAMQVAQDIDFLI